MPKGVEHLAESVLVRMKVIFPLMPKGVEHRTNIPRSSQDTGVIFPLMPKGVEHGPWENNQERAGRM